MDRLAASAAGRLASGPSSGSPIQRAIAKRHRASRYNKSDYRRSSKFRFIRNRRRYLSGFTAKGKVGINLFTVKYKKGGKSFYLTTRSVPHTNAGSFQLPSGHSEERFSYLKKKFEKRHKLKPTHLKWGATEREPCGHGSGMANCRGTLSHLGIPDDKVHYGYDYPDREDVRTNKKQSKSDLNEQASELREEAAQKFAKHVKWLSTDHDSDNESEDEDDVVDENESDYDEDEAPRRKRKVKKLENAFRGGWDAYN